MELTEATVGTVDVPLGKLPALNKSTEHDWFYSENGGVLAGLEVFHSLHCLDMVRQYTYKDEYDYSDNPTFQDDEKFVRTVSCLKLRHTHISLTSLTACRSLHRCSKNSFDVLCGCDTLLARVGAWSRVGSHT
jgi:hypothetical protein